MIDLERGLMNIERFNALETALKKADFASDGKFFAGANLIISNDPSRKRYDHDEFVFTPYAEEVSWVIFQLRDVFASQIDYLTKRGFYPALGVACSGQIEWLIGSSIVPIRLGG